MLQLKGPPLLLQDGPQRGDGFRPHADQPSGYRTCAMWKRLPEIRQQRAGGSLAVPSKLRDASAQVGQQFFHVHHPVPARAQVEIGPPFPDPFHQGRGA